MNIHCELKLLQHNEHGQSCTWDNEPLVQSVNWKILVWVNILKLEGSKSSVPSELLLCGCILTTKTYCNPKLERLSKRNVNRVYYWVEFKCNQIDRTDYWP